MEEFLKIVQSIQTEKVLDVATGRGEFINFLTNNLSDFKQIIGIDNDEKILKKARVKNDEEKVLFVKMKAEQMSYPDNYFDVVTISNSLHHMENLNYVLHEIHRVLKKQGYLLINEMIRDKGQTSAQNNHIDIHHWAAAIDRKRNRYHADTFTKKDITKIVAALPLHKWKVYENKREIENTLDEKLVKNLTQKIDNYIEFLEQQEDTEKLIEQGEMLKENIIEKGFASADSLLIIGIK